MSRILQVIALKCIKVYTYFYSVLSTCFVDIWTALHVHVQVVENNDTPLLDHDILIFFVLKFSKLYSGT